jgi:hypothetical protein
MSFFSANSEPSVVQSLEPSSRGNRQASWSGSGSEAFNSFYQLSDVEIDQ